MKKIVLIAGVCLSSLVAVHAQQDSTLNRTVIVENEYNPTVMDASKINVMPKVDEPKATKRNIDYATSLRPVSSWNYQAMSPVVREWETDKAYRGYLRAGYGNNGNADVKAGYLWDMTAKDRLNLSASLDGWNGDMPDGYVLDWKSRLYQTKIGLDYRHAFKKVDFLLGGSFRSQVFNYMPNPVSSLPASEIFDRQTQTLANVYLGLASTDENLPVQYTGEIGLNYWKQKYPTRIGEGNEKTVYAKANVWKAMDNQQFGVAADFRNYLYSMDDMEDATSLEVNPYYTWKNENVRVRLGAHVDWWSGAEDKVMFSPDVQLEYVFADSYVLFAKASGGRENRSLYDWAEITPYGVWRGGGIHPTYVNLDASVGLNASPMEGLWFQVAGGYQIRKDDWCYGESFGHELLYSGVLDKIDTKVAYGIAELKYDYKDNWGLSLKGTYYNWKISEWDWTGISEATALEFKPELELNAEAHFQVMTGLKIHAGYDYVKRYKGLVDPVNDLHAGAAYELLNNLQVFANVHNLLDKKYLRMDAYPAQGIHLLAGISLRF